MRVICNEKVFFRIYIQAKNLKYNVGRVGGDARCSFVGEIKKEY